jgi:hypothetical protein
MKASVASLLATVAARCDDRGLRSTPSVYRTDEHALLLVVASREPDTGHARRLSRIALRFLIDAQDGEGRSFPSMDEAGGWAHPAETADAWGLSLWALGSAATSHANDAVRASARSSFDRALRQRPSTLRSSAFAAIGASEVFSDDPTNRAARRLLTHVVASVSSDPADRAPDVPSGDTDAALAHAMILAGTVLVRRNDVEHGIAMLRAALVRVTRGAVFVVAADGPDHDAGLEVSTLGAACRCALVVTGDRSWRAGVDRAAAWFGNAERGEPTDATPNAELLAAAASVQLGQRLPAVATSTRVAAARS